MSLRLSLGREDCKTHFSEGQHGARSQSHQTDKRQRSVQDLGRTLRVMLRLDRLVPPRGPRRLGPLPQRPPRRTGHQATVAAAPLPTSSHRARGDCPHIQNSAHQNPALRTIHHLPHAYRSTHAALIGATGGQRKLGSAPELSTGPRQQRRGGGGKSEEGRLMAKSAPHPASFFLIRVRSSGVARTRTVSPSAS